MNIYGCSLQWWRLATLVTCGAALSTVGCGAATAPLIDDFGEEAPGGGDAAVSDGGSEASRSDGAAFDASADSGTDGGPDGGADTGSGVGPDGGADTGSSVGPDGGDGSTACPGVSGQNPAYFVDPIHGSDSTGTGNNSTSPQCALQTITRALEIVGSSPRPHTTIDVVGGTTETEVVTIRGVATGTPSAGQELFPLTIGSNVTLTTSTGPVTIEVPPNLPGGATTGLVLEGNPSAIVGGTGAALTIDGQTQTAGVGVTVQSPGASLSFVTIQNFADDGIEVSDLGDVASTLAIGPGVQSNGNVTDGLLVTGSSTATITATSGVPIQFNANGAHGVRVTGTGVITLTGSVGAEPPSSSTIVASGNGGAGIWVQTSARTQSTITGTVSTGSTEGNGIRIIPGSNVKVRGCWVLGNSRGNGIDIEDVTGATAASVADIDLGSRTSAGANVLQAVSGSNPNGGAGICLKLPGGSAAELDAQGNMFQAGVNCATTARVLKTTSTNACAAGADVGGTIAAFPGGAGDTIDVGMCSYR
ncbi:MAG TPA: right-handed parallel beta-helix repeat-containing protein [Polyangiaceae bacterium]|nr:right-handed parallel beta-helix repeat-containing protein [Polyangiaceae bacterium]